MSRLLIYGASGFTGGLVLREARAFGIEPIAAGRSRVKLETLFGHEREERMVHRAARADDPEALDRMLEDVAVVINAAGPFRQTALPLAAACIRRGVHYLDISGEVSSIEALAQLDRQARERGVMLMPAVGFDVAPSDCMAAWIGQRLPTLTRLDIGFTGLDAISRGSAQSLFEQYADLVVVRRGGRLTRATPLSLQARFDFGAGAVPCLAITWGDVASAHHTTGAADITVYYEATALVRMGLGLRLALGPLASAPPLRLWQQTAARMLPVGPDGAYRRRARASIVVRGSDPQGRCAEVGLHTPEVYTFTATSAVSVADRVLHGDFGAGFRTPGGLYGPGLVLSMAGVSLFEPRPS